MAAAVMSGTKSDEARLRARKPMPEPHPAYLPTGDSVLSVDQKYYKKIQKAPRELIETVLVPRRSGRAWKVPAKSIVRISTPEGPQVGDLNIWNADNPRERFWASRTRQLHASHVSTYDRLWSSLPYLRPLVTIIADSLSWYGVDETGGKVHDLLGTRCDPYVNTMLAGAGASYDYHCHSNLTRAVIPFGLTELDIHDVINVFQVTGLDAKGRYFHQASPAEKGDYIEFFAEQNLLMALSTCPGGDLSVWGYGSDTKEAMLNSCRPLKVEVFRLVDEQRVLGDNWSSPAGPEYRGVHGMTIPGGENC
ncbi:hypothetical protein ABEF95_015302 [Exophiala dermatitidis]